MIATLFTLWLIAMVIVIAVSGLGAGAIALGEATDRKPRRPMGQFPPPPRV
jgi:hypothetical protein